ARVVPRQTPRASPGPSEQGTCPNGAPYGGPHQLWPVVPSPPARDGLGGHGDGPWPARGSCRRDRPPPYAITSVVVAPGTRGRVRRCGGPCTRIRPEEKEARVS